MTTPNKIYIVTISYIDKTADLFEGSAKTTSKKVVISAQNEKAATEKVAAANSHLGETLRIVNCKVY